MIKTTVAAAEKGDVSKIVKEKIDMFSEGMTVFMNALDELKAIHPFIGGASGVHRMKYFIRSNT
jgi:hypothetical protein